MRGAFIHLVAPAKTARGARGGIANIGTTTKVTVSYYDGQFTDGYLEGEGRFVDDEFDYRGQWVADLKHGYGVEMNLKEKTVYEGQFKVGKKHGHGKCQIVLR